MFRFHNNSQRKVLQEENQNYFFFAFTQIFKSYSTLINPKIKQWMYTILTKKEWREDIKNDGWVWGQNPLPNLFSPTLSDPACIDIHTHRFPRL